MFQAYLDLEDYESASDDLKLCISVDAGNVAAKKLLVTVQNRVKEHRQKEKQLYAGMFDKFVKSDASRAAQARKSGVLKDGVGEWQDKVEDEEKGELSEVKLISSDDQIKGEEFMESS